MCTAKLCLSTAQFCQFDFLMECDCPARCDAVREISKCQEGLHHSQQQGTDRQGPGGVEDNYLTVHGMARVALHALGLKTNSR